MIESHRGSFWCQELDLTGNHLKAMHGSGGGASRVLWKGDGCHVYAMIVVGCCWNYMSTMLR